MPYPQFSFYTTDMNHDMVGFSPFFTKNYLLAQLDIRMMFLHKRSYF